MRNRVALAVVFAAAIASVAGCSKSDDSTKSPSSGNVTLTDDQRKNVHLFAVSRSGFHKTIETNGIVDFDNDQATSVVAPFSGPVARLLVSPGEQVKKGQPLASVESPDFAVAISVYRKALVAAATARKLANLDKDLLQHQSVSEREAAQAETDAASAEADRAAALQALDALNVDAQTIRDVERGKPIARTAGIIRAPIAGTLVEKLITPGQLLQAGTTPCFTVADLSRVWVMAQLFGSDLSSVTVGDAAQILTGIGATRLAGRVDNVSALVDPNTLAVSVRVAVDNPGTLLKKQMYVRVLIEDHRESTGLLIPVSAIVHDDENLPFVYVAGSDGSFARRHVTLGYRSGDRYDIAAGLKPDERVVADGALFLQFMQDQ